MTPNPRLVTRAAQAGLATGLAALASTAFLPSGHADSHAAPAPSVTVAAQTASEPVRVARASRSRTLPPKALPLTTVTRTVAVGPSFSGQASWYGPGFQGRRTASGERFDTSDLTAASKTLPFGTRVRVCHHGCVVVRINDRGPYVSGRVLDLSRAAARAIGIYGVGRVTATPVGQRQVRVVDRPALARQQAAERHAALVRRSHALRAQQQARAAAAEQARREAASATPLDTPRAPVGVAGGVLSGASAGLLGLRGRRGRRVPRL